TGLGLTIAKELIQLHQGKVYVESEYGNGTTFSIFFPRIP
ncbi:MAG: ATP-binding protein, partial [Promethearchaeota archaeon]